MGLDGAEVKQRALSLQKMKGGARGLVNFLQVPVAGRISDPSESVDAPFGSQAGSSLRSAGDELDDEIVFSIAVLHDGDLPKGLRIRLADELVGDSAAFEHGGNLGATRNGIEKS